MANSRTVGDNFETGHLGRTRFHVEQKEVCSSLFFPSNTKQCIQSSNLLSVSTMTINQHKTQDNKTSSERKTAHSLSLNLIVYFS